MRGLEVIFGFRLYKTAINIMQGVNKRVKSRPVSQQYNMMYIVF